MRRESGRSGLKEKGKENEKMYKKSSAQLIDEQQKHVCISQSFYRLYLAR